LARGGKRRREPPAEAWGSCAQRNYGRGGPFLAKEWLEESLDKNNVFAKDIYTRNLHSKVRVFSCRRARRLYQRSISTKVHKLHTARQTT